MRRIASTSFADHRVQPEIRSCTTSERTVGREQDFTHRSCKNLSGETMVSAVTAAHVRTTSAIEFLLLKIIIIIILWSNKYDDDNNDGDGGRMKKHTQNATAIDKRLKRKHNITDFRKTNGTRYLCGIHRRARVGRRNFLRSAAKTRENDN